MQILSLPIACLLRHVQADDARRSVPVCLGTSSGNRSTMNVANFIGVGWLLHTAWDVLHHLYGNPIIPFVPTSSLGCAICDPVIAVWCFAGGRSLIRGSRQGSAMPDFSTAARVRESGRFSSCAGFRDPEADRALPPKVSELLQLSAESIRIPHATQHQWHVTSRLPLQNKLLGLSDSPPSVPLSVHRPFT